MFCMQKWAYNIHQEPDLVPDMDYKISALEMEKIGRTRTVGNLCIFYKKDTLKL